MFEPSQIQEFKEAFGMIDANRDGFIDKEDLIATYASLGVTNVESSRLDDMIKVRGFTRKRTTKYFSGSSSKYQLHRFPQYVGR